MLHASVWLKECVAEFRGEAAGAAGLDVDEGPEGAGTDQDLAAVGGDGIRGEEGVAGRIGGRVVRGQAGDLVGAEGLGTAEGDGPGGDEEAVGGEGGAGRM